MKYEFCALPAISFPLFFVVKLSAVILGMKACDV